MATHWREYYKANKEKILERQKAWYRKNKTSPTRIKMTAEERRMAKNECEARRQERIKNGTHIIKHKEQPEIIIDPMPKMARGVDGIKEFLSGKR